MYASHHQESHLPNVCLLILDWNLKPSLVLFIQIIIAVDEMRDRIITSLPPRLLEVFFYGGSATRALHFSAPFRQFQVEGQQTNGADTKRRTTRDRPLLRTLYQRRVNLGVVNCIKSAHINKMLKCIKYREMFVDPSCFSFRETSGWRPAGRGIET